MVLRLRHHIRSNLIAYLALFVALGGTGAYAANTIGSEDVIDNSLRTQDIQTGTLLRQDHKPEDLTGTYILDGSLSFFDLAPGTIVNSRLADNAVTSGKVASNTLTGDDVNEGTLTNMRVVARARLQVPVSSAESGTEVNVPLTGNTWTQEANETDHFGAEITVTSPATCGSFIAARVRLKINGELLALEEITTVDGQPHKIRVSPGAAAPETATARTLTLTIEDVCTGEENFTVDAAAIDVAGAR